MTDAQLDAIQSALGIKLPADYRQVSLAFPFRPIGNDWVYWMYDDPDAVIGESRAPLEEGDYDRSNWRASYVVIGQSASGDPYLLDTAAERSPVYCLSHETHAIAPEWPTFEAFVADWTRSTEKLRQQWEAAAGRGRWRRWWLVMGLVILLGVALPLLLHALSRPR